MHQAAALPFRRLNGGGPAFEVLLVTSSSDRWIIPKGDVDDGMEPHRAAEKEAFEEGGVRGEIGSRSIGTYFSRKEQDGAAVEIAVDVYPLKVTEELERWPEMQRRRRWLPNAEAAGAVEEAGLAEIIRSFHPEPRLALPRRL